MAVPLIIAHRGDSAARPENTLSAFRQALAVGADLVEMDAQLTKDGQVVVLHDVTVNRTTDVPASQRSL
jgi:glycerophosphoryl diester phosphodiesterase